MSNFVICINNDSNLCNPLGIQGIFYELLVKCKAVSEWDRIKIERLMEEDRKIRSQVKKLISIFQD